MIQPHMWWNIKFLTPDQLTTIAERQGAWLLVYRDDDEGPVKVWIDTDERTIVGDYGEMYTWDELEQYYDKFMIIQM